MNLGKSTWIVIVIGAFVESGSAFADASTQSEQAVRQGGLSSGHASGSGSAAHAIAASGQATSAIAAVPLEIGDETITAMPPPDQALKNKAGKAQNGI